MPHRIVIVGAGLAGSLLACALARDGHEVVVYERRGDPRSKGYVGGRSINLAISTRGLHALRQVGLDDAVLATAVRMPGRMIHPRGGATVYQPYSADPTRAINSVSRSGLNLTLMEAAAREPRASFRFDHLCVDVDPSQRRVTFRDRDGRTVVDHGDLVVGCDGAFSCIRSTLQRTEGFDYSQSYLGHGYKELSIPPRSNDGEWAMEPHALHIWPRGGFMMIALPNQDRSFTCTLFLAHRGESDDAPGFDRIHDDDDVRRFMLRWFPDAVPLMPTLLEDFRSNPVGAMVTIRCRPWHRGRIVLLGDGAHAVVPFYGQGANCAFEDCTALVECLRRHAGDLDATIATYEALRIDNANAIADLALRNFVEMRDHTASRVFRMKKRLEHALHRIMPRTFVPLYDMISFSTIPYAEARDRARRQWRRVALAAIAAALLLVAAITTWLATAHQ
ncbi:MAG: NAD(P)/FAD-dependent oxidoreductase [Phycisphaerales bacterium]